MGLPLRDNRYHTYSDYLSWPEDTRYELIDGLAYLMAPAPALDHQEVAGEIYFQLRRALEGKPCRAFMAPVWEAGERMSIGASAKGAPTGRIVCYSLSFLFSDAKKLLQNGGVHICIMGESIYDR